MDRSVLDPLLAHIQTHLEDDLSLAALGRISGYSPFHLQRDFKAAIGESPRAYVERLRLERSAFRLAVQRASVLEIALEHGFRGPEPFLRAFRRRYGTTPSGYRRRLRRTLPTATEEPAESVRAWSLSATRCCRLRPLQLACRRHLGPYESVPESLFEELAAWRSAQGLASPPIWLGIGHDAPGLTPPAELRFDAACVVPAPFVGRGAVRPQRLAGGDFAVTLHAGPYDSLPAAYAQILPRILAWPDWELVGLPAVEFYGSTRIDVSSQLNRTEIWLPIRRRRGRVTARRAAAASRIGGRGGG